MCNGCDPAQRVCPECKQFMDAAVSHGLVERVLVLERQVNELWTALRNLRGV